MPRRRLALAACRTDGTGADDANPAASPTSTKPSTGGAPLTDALGKISTSAEHNGGYKRTNFHLWIDADHDGCDTRREVLLAEAVTKPRQGKECKLTGGSWTSYYDDQTITDASKLDIDHVVPLAEAWASGAWKWPADRREAYANDLEAARTLVAVSAHTNRSKSDRDPAEWMPPADTATCTYAADWVAAKLRWGLSADKQEHTALAKTAKACPDTTVTYTPAP